MSAADVLSIPHVAKSIILHLPLRQVLHMRRVCKALDQYISDSRDIRQALWLGPVVPSVAWKLHTTPDPTRPNRDTGDWKTKENTTVLPIANPFIANTDNMNDPYFYDRNWYADPEDIGVPVSTYFGRKESVTFTSADDSNHLPYL